MIRSHDLIQRILLEGFYNEFYMDVSIHDFLRNRSIDSLKVDVTATTSNKLIYSFN